MENIIHEVSGLLNTLTFLPSTALRLAFLGTILLVVFFALALVIGNFSNIKKLTKKLLAAIRGLASFERVDEDNVEILNAELIKLPEAVQDGWGRFMEQRIGYPSDYMKEKSVLDENTYSTKNTVAKIFFRIFGFLAVAFMATLATFALAEDAANVGLKDFTNDFKVVGGIIGAVAFPILFYIIFDVIISAISKRQRSRLQLVNKSFLDTLDEKVVIYASEEEEFRSDNLEQITQDIEDIIAQRMDNNEAIEVVTTPEVVEFEKNEIVEEVASEEPLQEIVAEEPIEEPIVIEQVEDIVKEMETEEVVATSPISKEERENYLVVLISIVENAIADPAVKMSELEEIAELIYSSLDAFVDKEDIEILEECLRKLSDVFFGNQ